MRTHIGARTQIVVDGESIPLPPRESSEPMPRGPFAIGNGFRVSAGANCDTPGCGHCRAGHDERGCRYCGCEGWRE